MEFKEFTNPEEKDYDINISLNSYKDNSSVNPYTNQLIDLIGILEDISEEELYEKYGISIDEYLHPTEDTINKVTRKISRKHR